VVAVVIVTTWVVATALPAWSEVIWAGGVLVILAVALGALIARARGMGHSGPSPFNGLLQQHDSVPVRPADLERIERLAGWVAYSPHDFRHRIKPMLLELIGRRLHSSEGIEFKNGALPSSELLSPELVALLDPAEPNGAAVTTADLNRALDEIETL
jgi:hypothetical protein